MNCYKKRVKDNELIFIGKFVKHDDKEQYDIDIYFPSVIKVDYFKDYDVYYPSFYNIEKEIVEVDYSYYECQLYTNSFTLGDTLLPNVKGLSGYVDSCYYDLFIEEDMVKLLLEINN